MDYLEPEIDEPKSTKAPKTIETKEQKDQAKTEKKIKKSIFESGDISSYSPVELSALFLKHTKKAFPLLSDIELQDLAIPGKFSNTNIYFTRVIRNSLRER